MLDVDIWYWTINKRKQILSFLKKLGVTRKEKLQF